MTSSETPWRLGLHTPVMLRAIVVRLAGVPRLWSVLLAPVLLLCSMGWARAAPRDAPSIAVMEAELDGAWPGLRAAGVREAVLVGLEEVDEFAVEKAGAAACDDATCWSRVAGEQGASHLLLTKLRVTGRDANLRLEVYEGDGGLLVASSEASCELCATAELREMITATTVLLRPRLASLLARGGTLVVDATPTGADVLVDGEVVGQAPYRGSITPGTHSIVIAEAGHHTHVQESFAEPGETILVEVDLPLRDVDEANRPAPVDDAARRRLGPTGVAGIAALGAGAGLVGTSIALLVIDGDPLQSSCPPEGPDGNGRCPEMHGTRAAGIATAVIGGSALVTGAVLLGLDRTRPRRTKLTIGPRSIWLTARF